MPAWPQVGRPGEHRGCRSAPARGRRDVRRARRADVENEVGFELEHHLQIGRVAAPRKTAELRPGCNLWSEVSALFGTIGTRPPQEQVRRECVEQDRRWRTRRKHALDVNGRGTRRPAPSTSASWAGAWGAALGGGQTSQEDTPADFNHAAIPPWSSPGWRGASGVNRRGRLEIDEGRTVKGSRAHAQRRSRPRAEPRSRAACRWVRADRRARKLKAPRTMPSLRGLCRTRSRATGAANRALRGARSP